MPRNLKAFAIAALVVPLAVSAPYALAQSTGVSHPEEVPVETTTEPAFHTSPQRVPLSPKPSAIVPTEPTSAVPPAPPVTYQATYTPLRPAAAADVDGEIVERIEGPSNQLPAGTLLHTRLDQAVSTATTRIGSTFTAPLQHAVERDGRVLLPAGSVLTGRVSDLHGGKRVSGRAMIHLEPLSVLLPDGTRYNLRGQVVDTGLYNANKVSRDGEIERRDHATATVAELGLATGAGAAAGGVFGGVPGALIGAGVGAGLGTAVWLRQDHQTELPAETAVTFSLTSPLTVGLN